MGQGALVDSNFPPPASLDQVDWRRYDFIDFGCSAGDSIPHCQRRFRARQGLGVDIDPAKIAKARSAGLHAVQADVAQLAKTLGSTEGMRIKFVSMIHFLEHLPNARVAEEVMASAAKVGTDFLFIRHPSFEGEAQLAHLGLRQYWWDWTGHPNHLRVSDYCTMFDRLGLHQYFVRYHEPIWDSTHWTILRSDERKDQHSFDPTQHRPRPDARFTEPLWREQEIFVALRAFDLGEWSTITKAVSQPAPL